MATSMNEVAAHIVFTVKKQMSTGAQFTFSFIFSQTPAHGMAPPLLRLGLPTSVLT